LLGLYFIRGKISRPLAVASSGWLLKSFTALTSMVVVLYLYMFLLPYTPSGGGWLRGGWCAGAVTAGCITYAFVTITMRFDEWRWIKEAMKGKKEGMGGKY